MTLRIAMFTHSVNPRGGVAHALAVAEALTAEGHEVVVHGPDPGGTGFYRTAACPTVCLKAAKVGGGLAALVPQRVREIGAHVAALPRDRFDVYHAQDGMTASALLELRAHGHPLRVARTVHHLSRFAEAEVQARDDRAVDEPDLLFCVSRHWQDVIRERHRREAHVVGNGVDTGRFSPEPGPQDAALRAQLDLGHGPVFLTVGGIEARKNTKAVLAAFKRVGAALPGARLVIAGGATLLDHSAYRASFAAELAELGPDLAARLRVTGPLPQPDMEALYRLADALVFPSLEEGFGLAVIEAMASGTPVVTADRPPFTDYLRPQECLWVDPEDPVAIAAAMRAVVDPAIGRPLASAGRKAALRFTWREVASRHLPAYADLLTRREAA